MRSFRTYVLAFFSLLLPFPVFAQVATGFPPFASFSGGPDIVDNAIGNVHISIPVLVGLAAGLPFPML